MSMRKRATRTTIQDTAAELGCSSSRIARRPIARGSGSGSLCSHRRGEVAFVFTGESNTDRFRFVLSMQSLVPQMERRTVELLACMERRQLESKTGYVDLADAMYHWAHDFMVRHFVPLYVVS